MATKRLSPITPAITVAEGGTNITSATAAGGIVYTASTTAYGTTAAGSTGQYLKSGVAGAPTWATLQASDLSDNSNIVHIAGTETVTGAKTFSGGLTATTGSFSSTLGVTGTSTLGVVNASGAVATGALTVTGAASASTTITAGTGLTVTTGNIGALNGYIYAASNVASTGSSVIGAGDTTHSGLISFYGANGNRSGYIGFAGNAAADSATINYWGGAHTFGSGLVTATGGLTVTGTATATTFSGAGTSLTGTAASLSIGGTAALASGLTGSPNVTTGTITSGLINAQTISSAANFTGSLAVATTLTAATLTLTNDLAVAQGGTGVSTAPAAGSVIYGVSTTQYGQTGAGTAGQALLSGGAGIPTWKDTTPIHVAAVASPPGSPATNDLWLVTDATSGANRWTAAVNASPPSSPATNDLWLVTDLGANLTAPTDGGIVYGDGSNYKVTAAGTTGQTLLSQGSGIPVWDGPPGQIMAVPVSTSSNGTASSGTTETRDAVLGNYVFTAVSGHRYEVRLNGFSCGATPVAADIFAVNIRNGGGSTPTASSTLVASQRLLIPPSPGTGPLPISVAGTFAPGAGTQTLSVFTVRVSGTGTVTPYSGGTTGRELYVIDLGVSA